MEKNANSISNVFTSTSLHTLSITIAANPLSWNVEREYFKVMKVFRILCHFRQFRMCDICTIKNQLLQSLNFKCRYFHNATNLLMVLNTEL